MDKDGRDAAFHTAIFEISRSAGERRFDWANKVVVQLAREELPLVIGVFLGYLSKVSFSNHGMPGEMQKKFFSIEHQGVNVYFSAGQHQGVNGALPISVVNAGQIAMVLLAQYTKNFDGLDAMTVKHHIAEICNYYVSAGFTTIKDKLPNKVQGGNAH